jgi:hypothetical protein
LQVYDDESTEDRHSRYSNRDVTYIYPTSLPSLHEQARFSQAVRDCKDTKRSVVRPDDVHTAVLSNASHVTTQQIYGPGKQSSIASSAGLRNIAGSAPVIASNKNMELYQSRCHPVRDLGLAVPLPRFVQPAELSRREHEIYSMPDSDDEFIDLPTGYVSGPSFPPPNGKIATPVVDSKDTATSSNAVKYIMRV